MEAKIIELKQESKLNPTWYNIVFNIDGIKAVSTQSFSEPDLRSKFGLTDGQILDLKKYILD